MNRKRKTTLLIYLLCTTLLVLSVATSFSFAQSVEPTPESDASETNENNDEDDSGDNEEQNGYYDQLIIKLDPTINDVAEKDQILADLAALYDLSLTNVTPALASRNIYLLDLIEQTDDAELVEDEIDGDLDQDGRVAYVEPHYTIDIPQPESEHRSAWFFGQGDGIENSVEQPLDLLNMDNVHHYTTGKGITVAVIDTGIMVSHTHFVDDGDSVFIQGWDFILDQPIMPTVSPEITGTTALTPTDAIGHGTHVAGIIHTIAPAAHIMPLRALDDTGEGALYVIAEAIWYAAENGADIINLSLGTTYESDLLKEAVEEVYEEYGVLVVAAAGNSNSDVPHYPAAFNEESAVLAVTSVYSDSRRAESANYGEWVDIAAPGEGIYSAIHHPLLGECNMCYASWSGTSMATPFITGEAALLAELFPSQPDTDENSDENETSDEEEHPVAKMIYDAIIENTTPITNPDPIELMGAGIANVGQATMNVVISSNPIDIPTNIVANQIDAHISTRLFSSIMLFIMLVLVTKWRMIRKIGQTAH